VLEKRISDPFEVGVPITSSAVRSSVAGVRERAVRSTRAAEAVAELGSLGKPVLFRNITSWIGLAIQ
jgi:hypothetical protein